MCLYFRLDFFLQNPDVLCNGRGTCGCNFCECTDPMFGGTFCDALVSCADLKITAGHWPFSDHNYLMANHFPK